ncbi:restriction endonuclease subunit S [Lactococcus lactis]|nr:restriction endonuclease subunit S [Lactococcus lactis]RXS50426.1 restriction endonuclease subunit S [Lactococcus lactis]
MMSKKSPQLRFEGFTDDWEERKLSSISERVTRKNKNNESTLPLTISAQDGLIDQNDFFNKQVASRDVTGYFLVKNGEFAYNKSYSNGYPWGAIKRLDKYDMGVLSTLYIVFRPTEINSQFLVSYYDTTRWYREVSKNAAEGARNHGLLNIAPTDFFNTLLVVPKIVDEQEKIGSFFKQMDNTIALHQRKLDLLKEQKKGYLQKMFPKNGEKVPELRFAGFANDWEEHKLGDYIIQYSEKTKQNNQYPVFTSSRNGLFFQKDYYKGNQIASEDNIGYNIVPRGYFTYRHMSDDLVFKFNINDLADYGIVSTLYPVFTTNEQLNSKYLQYQLNEGSEFRRFSLLQKQGGSRTYMYLNKLQNMILNIPKLEEQQKIGSFFKQLDDTIALHQRKLDLLKEQKKGFLQKMFV